MALFFLSRSLFFFFGLRRKSTETSVHQKYTRDMLQKEREREREKRKGVGEGGDKKLRIGIEELP